MALGMLIVGLRQMRKYSYDVIECYGGESWLLMWLLSKRPHRKWKLIHHSNGIESHAELHLASARKKNVLPPLPRYRRVSLVKLYDLGVRCADYLVTVSNRDKEFALHKKLCRPKAVMAIENSLPEEFLGLSVKSLRPKVIGYCGNWVPIKNINVIAKDIFYFLSENRDWRFEVVGAGSSSIKAHPDFKHVQDQVTCLESVSRTALRSWYESIAILILPSIYESFGLVAAEAMACGCAVLATKTTGFAGSLQHDQAVFLMDSEDSPGLYKALIFAVKDESLRQRVGMSGYECVQRLSWKRALDSMESVYKELTGGFKE
jgi:glycosyltransferase involved in cell wall biosynthesis